MSIDQALDPDAFRDFEHAGWMSNVSEYEAAFARVTSQAIGPLLDAVYLRHGARLLDVATGPGYVAAAAAERGARAVGVDFSAPMVAHARAINPTVEFQEGDAEALSFADGSFDAVVMNFGMLHLARPERAMTEAARVLKPGGRFAFTVWASRRRQWALKSSSRPFNLTVTPGCNCPRGRHSSDSAIRPNAIELCAKRVSWMSGLRLFLRFGGSMHRANYSMPSITAG